MMLMSVCIVSAPPCVQSAPTYRLSICIRFCLAMTHLICLFRTWRILCSQCYFGFRVLPIVNFYSYFSALPFPLIILRLFKIFVFCFKSWTSDLRKECCILVTIEKIYFRITESLKAGITNKRRIS